MLSKKKNESEKESEEVKYRNVRNLADAVVVYEKQFKIRFHREPDQTLQILTDARFVLGVVKTKVKFTVHKCLRKHPQLLSSSQFKSRHQAKFLQP